MGGCQFSRKKRYVRLEWPPRLVILFLFLYLFLCYRVILGHTPLSHSPISPTPAPVHLSLQQARPSLSIPKPVSALPQQMYLPSHHVASVGHKMAAATLVKQPGSSATVVAAPKLGEYLDLHVFIASISSYCT